MKKKIRSDLKSRLDQMKFEDMIIKSGKLSEAFFQEIATPLKSVSSHLQVVSFVPMENEPQINIELEGKNEPYGVAYVRIVDWISRKMVPVVARRDQPAEWEELETPSGKRIFQPGHQQEVCLQEDISVILVPALGLSEAGDRIGRGAGFYDRFLKEYPSALRVAIAFENQIIPSFQSDPWDEKVDVILTENGIRKILSMKNLGEWQTRGKIIRRNEQS